MAEDQGKEEGKFDFTPEGEAIGYISLDQARVLAKHTAGETPGNYFCQYQGVPMVFQVMEDTETEDHYMVTLSFRPKATFPAPLGKNNFLSKRKAQ